MGLKETLQALKESKAPSEKILMELEEEQNLKRLTVFWVECKNATQVEEAREILRGYYTRKDRKMYCDDAQCQVKWCENEEHGLGYPLGDAKVMDRETLDETKIYVVCRSKKLYIQRPSLYQYLGSRGINVRIGIK